MSTVVLVVQLVALVVQVLALAGCWRCAQQARRHAWRAGASLGRMIDLSIATRPELRRQAMTPPD